MKLKSWFTPGLIGLHILGVLALLVCVAGGLWQLGAYQAQQGDAADRSETAPRPDLTELWRPREPFKADLKSREVTVSGEFAPADEQFWVADADSSGRFGLVAPFVVDGTDTALLVVRGGTRSFTDFPGVPPGRQNLTVSLQPSAPGAPPLDERRVTTSITIPSLLNELDVDLWSGYGIVTDGVEPPVGFELIAAPDPEVAWTVGLTNLAYTLQWWVFGLFTVFMWWRMARESVQGPVDSLVT